MPNFTLPDYDIQRDWIRIARNKERDWKWIMYAGQNTDAELDNFLKQQTLSNFWKSMSCDEWKELVQLQKKAEEETKDFDYQCGLAMIMEEGQDNAVTVPNDPNSAWQLYRKKLLGNGFDNIVVDEMERTTLKILKRLNNDTSTMPTVKGLVIGNVQSGKTANMAALMAMAADWGWNMFIVLSGTIENLRQQTQNRLFNDLNDPGNLMWYALEHLSKRAELGKRAQDLHFDKESKQRYLTVCLKNAGRLKNLIQWLQSDPNKQKQMKILVIDDEADQAGINTANIKSSTIKTINRLIRDLVNGKNEKSQNIQSKYKAMNYIGYTATPYANILNEAGEDSLYPRSFITTLGVSKEYFGPQQIFGLEGGDYDFDGMDIVRIINERDLNRIKEIHDGENNSIPLALQEAICWFLCGVACMRIWGYKKPISMLIHTSQKTDHHENVATSIKDWIINKEKKEIVDQCKKIWNSETRLFTLERFREQYPQYGREDKDINQYPEFDDIKKQLDILLTTELTNIPLDNDYEFTYHKGIHMCIDNCKNNGVNDDGMYVRLAYPTAESMPDLAPAFIVIGGATLSRGLTIEGLISTFFLRSVGQADTLMQMGRWFGYRKGYELLPRVWITSKTNDQFKFLAELDQELRDEIQEMDILGKSPAQYGPRVKNTPKTSFIRITAKNRMQSAKSTDMDYSGSYTQTYLFDNDFDTLNRNIQVVTKFIESLGMCEVKKDCNKNHSKNTFIWRQVDFSKVKKLLKQYTFQERLHVAIRIEAFISWIDKMTKEGKLDKWNVVLAGKLSSENSVWESPIGAVNKVCRTRKKSKNESDTVINIGVLRDPKDIIADIDLEGQTHKVKSLIEKFKFTSREVKNIRSLAGLDTTPQLIIYMIDKNSAVEETKKDSKRKNLDAVEDIVGLCINIPGGRKNTSYTTTVSIHFNKDDMFNGNGDLEGTNED